MSNWRSVLNQVNRSTTFLIASHHNPDADALGSSLAIALWLKKMGKKVYVYNEDKVARWLEFLPASSWVKLASTAKRMNYDCAIICDCGDIKRIGGVERLLIEGKPMINIDHHATNPNFGTINIVDPTTSSTSELVSQLLDYAKCELDKRMATLLYAGIMTDTGSFRYDITKSSTHALAAKLLAFNVNPARMYEALFPGMPANDLAHFINIIHQAQMLFDNQLYVVSLTQSDVAKFSLQFDWKERVLGFLRSVTGVKVVLILSEQPNKQIRINLRSQSDIDVAKICAKVNGGGHPKAAGATLAVSLEEAKKQMVALLRKSLC